MSNNSLSEKPEWAALQAHGQELESSSISALFKADPKRFEHFHRQACGLVYDYSKQRVTSKTIEKLCALAHACDLEGWREKMISGRAINTSENRPVLHMALRGSLGEGLEIDGENVSHFVQENLALIRKFSEEVRADEKLTDVIVVGIGGSDLGPRLVYEALEPCPEAPRLHFLSTMDGAPLDRVLRTVAPENALVILSSKSFGTDETLTHAHILKDWLAKPERLYAVTGNIQAALDFGVPAAHILPMRSWIGGRFSLWSAIGLPIAIGCGFDRFSALLEGARTMDSHFMSTPLAENIPVLAGLIGIWNRNVLGYNALAVLPYMDALRNLPAYLQQMDMESNGKSVDREGRPVSYATGPIVFGETGTNAQHAFMQLLHQGTEIIPSDFIIVAQAPHDLQEHHTKLLCNALAQSQALMEGQQNEAEPHRAFPGNRPSSTIVLPRLDAFSLGALMALYEHKIFVQGALWGINSFDQWGVELGKVIARDLYREFSEKPDDAHDGSTAALLKLLKSFD